MPSSASAAFRSKYGKYLPHQRFNVDQVPLPFINGMDDTYEEVGAKRVAINQNGLALALLEPRLPVNRALLGTVHVL